MEIILSVLFLIAIWGYFKLLDNKTCDYLNGHDIDFGKMNDDRILNDLSNSQVNKNVLNGKYNKK